MNWKILLYNEPKLRCFCNHELKCYGAFANYVVPKWTQRFYSAMIIKIGILLWNELKDSTPQRVWRYVYCSKTNSNIMLLNKPKPWCFWSYDDKATILLLWTMFRNELKDSAPQWSKRYKQVRDGNLVHWYALVRIQFLSKFSSSSNMSWLKCNYQRKGPGAIHQDVHPNLAWSRWRSKSWPEPYKWPIIFFLRSETQPSWYLLGGYALECRLGSSESSPND